jgi:EAL domain-containing protein (putative c-di-GMP-specific phosphodiesterase class I)
VRRATKSPLGDAIRRLIDARDCFCAFQPIVDVKTQKIFAYEALARTKSRDFEGPMQMFAAAVAESCTGELGRMLRGMALGGCSTHPLFLNIHPAELNERWVVQPDDPIFQHTEDVYLEITEAVPLSHFRLCKDMLNEVRGRGVHLVVDDLGAGYSNLKYIADLTPRVVKLDRGLVAGLTRDSRLFKLVSAIVRLCGELDARVVAEGIETPAELDAVIAAGARYVQGYLLARPAFPPPDITWPEEVRVPAVAEEPRRPSQRASTHSDKKL